MPRNGDIGYVGHKTLLSGNYARMRARGTLESILEYAQWNVEINACIRNVGNNAQMRAGRVLETILKSTLRNIRMDARMRSGKR